MGQVHYVYVRKDCLQCKKDDEEVYVYVSVVSVSECSRVVSESSV